MGHTQPSPIIDHVHMGRLREIPGASDRFNGIGKPREKVSLYHYLSECAYSPGPEQSTGFKPESR